MTLALPFAGVGALLVGALFAPHYEYSDPALLPALRQGIEGFNPVSIAALLAVGWIAGRFSSVPVLIVGPAALLLLPVVSIVEIRLYSAGHSVWPLEWFGYGVMSLIPIVAAGFGRWKRLSLKEPI